MEIKLLPTIPSFSPSKYTTTTPINSQYQANTTMHLSLFLVAAGNILLATANPISTAQVTAAPTPDIEARDFKVDSMMAKVSSILLHKTASHHRTSLEHASMTIKLYNGAPHPTELVMEPSMAPTQSHASHAAQITMPNRLHEPASEDDDD